MAGLAVFNIIPVGSVLALVSGRGFDISVASVVWIAIGFIFMIILIPWLYRRSLRKKQGDRSLRQFLMQDEKLRDSLREHYEKRKQSSGIPPENKAS